MEFAFVAPVVLVFLLGLVDAGIAVDRRIVLDHAVREGARYASVGGDYLTTGTPASVQQVKDYTAAQSQGIASATAPAGTNGSIAVCRVGTSGIKVSIAYTHSFVTGFTSLFNTSVGNIVMNPAGNARIERSLSGTVPSC